MNIYVDKLPECCRKCPCMNDDIDYGNHCNIICVNDLKLSLDWDGCQRFRHKDCPLQTTQALKQQVRKEVVEGIKERLKKANLEIMSPIDLYSYTDNFLYQVEKEIKGE